LVLILCIVPLDSNSNPMKTIFFGLMLFVSVQHSHGEIVPFQTTAGQALSAAAAQSFAFLRVHRMADDASVNWGITNPLEVAYFIIERSEDGSNFLSVHEMPASGAASYRYRDVTAIPGYTYYRVLAVNMDGSVTESEIVELRIVKRK
jgi:hypothetical protein